VHILRDRNILKVHLAGETMSIVRVLP
jgi:hypothetical protein